MKKSEIARRYLVFLVGLFANAVGVALITRANLGTSPISSIPYTLSLRFSLSLGAYTALFNAFLIVSQMALLRRQFSKINLLQFPVAAGFGVFIDFAMKLLYMVHPSFYPVKLVFLLMGCVFLGFGVFLEVLANVVMLPGEAFVKAVSIISKQHFAVLKVVFDGSMTLCSGIMSLVFFRRLVSVREGSIIAALIVGMIAKFFAVHLWKYGERLIVSPKATRERE